MSSSGATNSHQSASLSPHYSLASSTSTGSLGFPQQHSLLNQFLATSYQNLFGKSTNGYQYLVSPSNSNGFKSFPGLHMFASLPACGSPTGAQLQPQMQPPLASPSQPPARSSQPHKEDDATRLLSMSNLDLEKSLIYQHRFFPLLKFMFEKVEEATRNPEAINHNVFTNNFAVTSASKQTDSRNERIDIDQEIGNFIFENQHLFFNKSRNHYYSTNEHVNKLQQTLDNLMVNAILVLRIHLLEIEKVNELCRDFVERYIETIKIKLNSDNIFKIDEDEDENEDDVGDETQKDENDDDVSDGGAASKAKRRRKGVLAEKKKHNKKLKLTSLLGKTATSAKKSVSDMDSRYQILPETSMASISMKMLRINTARSTPPPPPLSHDSSDAEAGNMIAENLNDNIFDDEDDDNDEEEITIDDDDGNVDEDDDDADVKSPSCFAKSGSSTDLSGAKEGSDAAANKLKRGILPKSATNVMKKWLFQHLVHPYPSEDEKKQIASKTNLTLIQVNNWFINARRRILQPMLEASNPDLTKKKKSSQSSTTKPYQNNRYWPASLSKLASNASSSPSSSSSPPNQESILLPSSSASSGRSATKSSSSEKSTPETAAATKQTPEPKGRDNEGEASHYTLPQPSLRLPFIFNPRQLPLPPQQPQSQPQPFLPSFDFSLSNLNKFLFDPHTYSQYHNLFRPPTNATVYNNTPPFVLNHFQQQHSNYLFPPSLPPPPPALGSEIFNSHNLEVSTKKEKKSYSAFKIENLLCENNKNSSNNNAANSTQKEDSHLLPPNDDHIPTPRLFMPQFLQSPSFSRTFFKLSQQQQPQQTSFYQH